MNELLQDVFQTVAREGVDQGSGAIRSKKSVCPGGGVRARRCVTPGGGVRQRRGISPGGTVIR